MASRMNLELSKNSGSNLLLCQPRQVLSAAAERRRRRLASRSVSALNEFDSSKYLHHQLPPPPHPELKHRLTAFLQKNYSATQHLTQQLHHLNTLSLTRQACSLLSKVAGLLM